MAEQMVFPAVLDACCGSRMMWFDRKDPRALFIDKRREELYELHHDRPGGRRVHYSVAPDVIASFTSMPFRNGSFYAVVFDPPHLWRTRTGHIAGRYGTLPNDWRGALREGFKECFRVLKSGGLLVFKWAETEIPLANVLPLSPYRPLFGHRTGKKATTHWVVFMKEPKPAERICPSCGKTADPYCDIPECGLAAMDDKPVCTCLDDDDGSRHLDGCRVHT